MVVTWAYNAGTNTATATGSGSTNFAALVAADTAGGWGKYTADATGTQIICAGKVLVGGSGQTVAFADTSKQVIFLTGITSGGNLLATYNTGSSITLGTLINATAKTTSDGCSIRSLETTNTNNILDGDNINLYSCEVGSNAKNAYIYISTGKIYNCVFDNQIVFTPRSSDVFNVFMTRTRFLQADSLWGTTTLSNVSLMASQTYIRFANNATVSNIYGRGFTDTKSFTFTGAYTCYLVNPDFDTYSFSWTGAGVCYRQYTFDLQTAADATVTLTDKDDNVVFSVTADAVTGKIATQTVSRGYYNQTNGDTLQDYSPHTLTITGTGYIPYVRTFTLEEKTKWLIELHDQLAGNATEADVASGKLFYKDDADTILVGSKVEAPSGGATTYVTVTEAPEDYEPLKELVVCLLDQKNLIRKTAGIPLE